MRRLATSTLVACSIAAFAASACQLLVALDAMPAALDATVVDDASDVQQPPAEAGSDPCPLELPPKPDSESGEDRPETLRFAVTRWQLEGAGDEELCGNAALNLDKLTTRSVEADLCEVDRACKPRDKKPAKQAACDQPGGADNAIAGILGVFATILNVNKILDPSDPQMFLATGRVNFLFEVARYNGGANDRQVTVNFYAAAGIVLPDDAGVIPPVTDASVDAEAVDPPTLVEARALPRPWDGGAGFTWIVDSKTLNRPASSGFQVARFSTEGYVRDYMLVVPSTGKLVFPYTFGLLGGGGIPVRDGQLVGRLVPPSPKSGERWKLTHGRFAGRSPNNELLSMAGASRTLFDGGRTQICEDPLFYDGVHDVICNAMDLYGAENDAEAPCQQVSGAIAFASVQTDFAKLPNGDYWTGDTNLLGRRVPCLSPSDLVLCDDCNSAPGFCYRDGGRVPLVADASVDATSD